MTELLDLNIQLLNVEGKPDTYKAIETVKRKNKDTKKMEEAQEQVDKPVLVKDIIQKALLTNQFVFKHKKQNKRYKIFQKIQGVDVVSFTRREESLLREVVSRTFDVLTYGQVSDWLEGK